jgi:hypothetical protein
LALLSPGGFAATFLVWNSNPEADLAGYKVYSGTRSRQYTAVVDVGDVTQYELTNLLAGTTNFFSVTAYNAEGLESALSPEVSYAPSLGNTPPLISNVADRSIASGDILAIELQVTDAETSPELLVLNGASSNQILLPDAGILFGGSGSNRTVTVIPALGLSGVVTLTLMATDGELTTTQTFQLTINPENNAPTISDIPDQSIRQNSSIGPIGFTIGDAETAAGSLLVSARSSNPALLPNENITFGGSGSNRTVTATPVVDQSGRATITLIVSDGVRSTTGNWTLTVQPINTNTDTAPFLSSVRSTTIFAGGASLPIRFSVSDAETPPEELVVLALSDTMVIPDDNFTFEGSGIDRTLRVTAAAREVGWANIRLGVYDGAGHSVWTNFGVSVVARPAQLVYLPFEAEEGSVVAPMRLYTNNSAIYAATTSGNQGTVSFEFSVAEAGNYIIWARHLSPDNGHDSFFVSVDGVESLYSTAYGTWSNDFQWTRVNAPGVGVEDPRVLNLAAGTHTVVFRGREANCALDRIIICNDLEFSPDGPINTPPVLSTIPDQLISESTSTPQIPFSVGDAETDASELVLSAESSNPTLLPAENILFSGSGNNRFVTAIPLLGHSGSATVIVSVSDGELTAVQTFVVTVTPPNTPPIIVAPGNLAINEDTSTGPLTFTVYDAETPGLLWVSAVSSNPLLIPNANIVLGGSGAMRTLRAIPATNQHGTATIRLNVSDGQLMATASFVLTVNAVNDAPVISPIPDRNVRQDTSTGPINFVIADAETAASNLLVSASSSNPALVPNENIVFGGGGSNRTVTVTPALGQSGTTTISVSVSDGARGATDSWVLSVQPPDIVTNTPPVLSSVRSTTIFSGSSSLPIRFSVSDAETPPEELVVWAISSDITLIPDDNLTFEGSGIDRILRVRAATNQVGWASILLGVYDGSGNTVWTNFGVNVVSRPAELVYLPLEAEQGVVAAPMRLYSNPSAIYATTTSANQGTVSFEFSVAEPGNYIIWARHLSPDNGHDSFFVSVDGTESLYSTAYGTWSTDWQWTRVNSPGVLSVEDPRVLNLSAGTHRVVFRGREPECALDRIIICNDLEFSPAAGMNTLLTPSPSGTAKIVWESIPGNTYQVQAKLDFTDAWIAVSELIVAEDFQSSWIDTSSSGSISAYRVIQVE